MGVNFGAGNYQQYSQFSHGFAPAPAQAADSDSFGAVIKSSTIGSLPPVRRVMPLSDRFSSGDTLAGAGLATLMVINLPEDCRDIYLAGKQVKAFTDGKKYIPAYDYTKYQHHFSFFKGTLIDTCVKKLKNPQIEQVKTALYEMDKSIYDTKLGMKIKKFLNIKTANPVKGDVEDVFGNKMLLKEMIAPNKFAEITGRAMKRVTLLGVVALGVIELPKILKAFFGKDDGSVTSGVKQTVKSGINVTSILAGLAYGGAICFKKCGPIGSLVGMGLGATAGALLSSKIQEKIS